MGEEGLRGMSRARAEEVSKLEGVGVYPGKEKMGEIRGGGEPIGQARSRCRFCVFRAAQVGLKFCWRRTVQVRLPQFENLMDQWLPSLLGYQP
jgi:hypothetical protein